MSLGAALLCLVVGVADGDTLELRCGHHARERVRLAGIDAPEWTQPHGRDARNALAALVDHRQVTLQVVDRDRYGRRVAEVYLGPAHVNGALVRDGWAWCNTRFRPGQWCAPQESAARSARRGLWAERNPLAPWEWRQRHPAASRKPGR
ncbi:MAG TPA: thermonuclease family protein [Solimonas sp.]|nr:thermonuclease family protein [Solimonas sp.]